MPLGIADGDVESNYGLQRVHCRLMKAGPIRGDVATFYQSMPMQAEKALKIRPPACNRLPSL
jgi:hypothetical protein